MRRMIALAPLLLLLSCQKNEGQVSGILQMWHKVTIDFQGPPLAETSNPSPFLNYRLDVTFKNGDLSYTVPGYFAGDGNAANTGAESGQVWRVHFSPDVLGEWTYEARFLKGPNVSIEDVKGESVGFDQAKGSFTVAASEAGDKDYRSRGWLQYVGVRYLRFKGDGSAFLKAGTDSPENFLAYHEFDNTYAGKSLIHKYEAHLQDARPGDPKWQGEKGRAILGAVNYLSDVGVNSLYFITNNVTGDGDEVFPWVSKVDFTRFDLSKLDQWERVFSHMDSLGVAMHVLTQETENDQLLDEGELGPDRKLYYRELIARFGHHPALVWNLGEEISNSTEQIKSFAKYIADLDVYNHGMFVHTNPHDAQPFTHDAVYPPLYGDPNISGPSMQFHMDDHHARTKQYIDESAAAGHQWVVNSDEQNPFREGVLPDSMDFHHDIPRKKVLWGNLMAGGGGAEWYFGYLNAHNDLNLEDFRSRDEMWKQSAAGIKLFQTFPFWKMQSDDDLTSSETDYVLRSDDHILIYQQDAEELFMPNPIFMKDYLNAYSIQIFDTYDGTKLAEYKTEGAWDISTDLSGLRGDRLISIVYTKISS